MSEEEAALPLFSGFGIELEYMVVDSESLSVRPVVDQLLAAAGAGDALEVERGDMAMSNELALHVVELKTNGPSPQLAGVAARFQAQLQQVEAMLAPLNARILPSGMHPWMDPAREFVLWPHTDNAIYSAFDRIFGCEGHGWSNLQSMHINLPFANDEEFGRLHAAIRLVLPLLPGLAASSPFVEGARAAELDHRLAVYRDNARRVPQVSGSVIPERVWTRKGYEEELLGGIYRAMAPLDPEGTLRHEWVNARGCIARFDRMALEIRLLDVQECPAADLAIAAAVVAVVVALVQERSCSYATQRSFSEGRLLALLEQAIVAGDEAWLHDREFIAALGHESPGPVRLGTLWQGLVERCLGAEQGFDEWQPALSLIFEQGCLARRLVAAVGPEVDPERLREVYGRLADCLREGRLFSL